MRKLGWIRDKKDKNDYKAIFPGVKVQRKSDLSYIFKGTHFDQDGLGLCYSFGTIALVYAELVIKKQPLFTGSPLMLGYLVAVMENSVGQDIGGMPRDAVKALIKQGVCSEKRWPYDPSKFGQKPPKVCYAEAQAHQLLQYSRVNTLTGIRRCLSSGLPCGLGFSVYTNFPMESRTGIVPMPSGVEEGGHYTVAVGHDDATRQIKFLNWWFLEDGTPWGDNGYGYMPYEYFDPALTGDHWIVKRMEA
jgi:hypothetical protein